MAGGPAFRSLGRNQQGGCPTLRFCAKGGRDAACSADFDVAQIQYFQQHHTRPCQQRKDGGPTLIDRVGSSKPGPPAQRNCKSARQQISLPPLDSEPLAADRLDR